VLQCLVQVVACMTEEAHIDAAKQQQRWRGWYNDQVGPVNTHTHTHRLPCFCCMHLLSPWSGNRTEHTYRLPCCCCCCTAVRSSWLWQLVVNSRTRLRGKVDSRLLPSKTLTAALLPCYTGSHCPGHKPPTPCQVAAHQQTQGIYDRRGPRW
jgi:hypothetical protein